jgi:sugar phosphate isomerase/epimerase
MLIGAMNHPMRDPLTEIEAFSRLGFEFVDLTLEPALARSDRVDATAIRGALRDRSLRVVGHTAYYLPIASPFVGLRQAALDEMCRCLDVFVEVGAKLVNVHPDFRIPLHDEDYIVSANVEAIGTLVEMARERGLRMMVENVPGTFNRKSVLRKLFRTYADLGFHLDVGHANLGVDGISTAELLRACGERLVHVHLSDNRGGLDDLHLPLGAGRIDWRQVATQLVGAGYDGTVTLEVFSPDQDYLALSTAKWRRLWDEAVAARPSAGHPPS